MSDFQFILKQ